MTTKTEQIAERIIFALEAFRTAQYIIDPTEQSLEDVRWMRVRYEEMSKKIKDSDRAARLVEREFIVRLIEEGEQ